MPPELRAYAVCRTCAEVYPSGQPCPSCAGVVVAARSTAVVERQRARRLEEAWFEAAQRTRPSRVSTAVLGVTLFAGLMLLLAALTRA